MAGPAPARDAVDHVARVEGLGEVGVRFERGMQPAGLGRHRDDGNGLERLARPDRGCEAITVEAWHSQIQQDEARRGRWPEALQDFEPLDSIGGGGGIAPEALDEFAEGLADVRVVFDDKDVSNRARHYQ